MQPDQIKHGHKYGQPLHKFGAPKFKWWRFISVFIIIGLFCAAYYAQDPEAHNIFDTWFLTIFLSILSAGAALDLLGDKNKARLIIYTKGIWLSLAIPGCRAHFIPWGDIDFLERHSTGGHVVLWHIVIHVNDKKKYNAKLSIVEKAFCFFEYWKFGSYQYIPVTNLVDIKSDELLELLEFELRRRR